jgi:hypothetical protein
MGDEEESPRSLLLLAVNDGVLVAAVTKIYPLRFNLHVNEHTSKTILKL